MTREQELLVHVERLNIHKCDKCPKVFPNQSDLNKHVLYHDESFLSHAHSAYVVVERAKLFTCEKCTQGFDTKREFMFHKLQHVMKNVRDERKVKKFKIDTDISKPFKCPDCEYKFVAQSTLDEHSILHKPMPHICKCGIGYFRQQDLIFHMKLVHGGEMDATSKKKKMATSPNKNTVIPERKLNNSKGPKLKAILTNKKKPASGKWKIKVKGKGGPRPKHEIKVPHPDIVIRTTPDERFECPDCKKTFGSKTNVYVHYRVHSGARPFPCDQCGKSFTQSGALTKHIATHVNEKNYVCQYCPKAFNTPENRARHEMIHSAVKQYECPFCKKEFHDPSAMIRHKRIHTGDKRYRCPYCPKAFTDVSGLYRHKLGHENKKDFSCEICKKKFYTRHDVRKHVAAHNQERNFCCDYCKQYYSSKANLAMHIKRHINAKNPLKCELCDRVFLVKDNLKTHILRMHDKTRDYECETCNRRFFNNTELRAHVLIHKNIKFECNDCSLKFNQKFSLARHYLSCHSGIQCDKCSQYFSCNKEIEEHRLKESELCEICEKEFFCKNVKDKHLKIHCTDKKQYECNECGMIYNHRKSIIKHLRSHMIKGN